MTQSITQEPQESRLSALAKKKLAYLVLMRQKTCCKHPTNLQGMFSWIWEERQTATNPKYPLVPEKAGRKMCRAEPLWVIAMHLIDIYCVGFWTVMNYWEMTEQIPYTVFVTTTKRKNSLKFGNQKFEFVTPSKKKLSLLRKMQAKQKLSTSLSKKKQLLTV